MPDPLYQSDALAWAEQQAALLRRLAAGERLNAAVDWPHVIEEVQDVGLSELRACQSLLQQAMLHVLKLAAWPDNASAAHWREETGTFLDDAARRFTPSMAQRIALETLYATARRRAALLRDDFGPSALQFPEQCPFALDTLLAGEIQPLVGRMQSATAAPKSPFGNALR